MTEIFLKNIAVIASIVGVISVLISLYGSLLYKKVSKKKLLTAKEYSLKFEDILKLFSEIHLDKASHSPQTIEEVIEFLQRVTDKYKLALDEITESNCRITVRVLSYEEGDFIIRPLVRDTFSESQYKIFDSSFKIRLTDDTAALSIFSGNKYFLENDLTKMQAFSSHEIVGKIENKGVKWMLPYSSTMVVPIPFRSELHKESLLGFLTIDSSKRMAFDKSIDISIAGGLADAMSPFLIIMKNFLSSKYH